MPCICNLISISLLVLLCIFLYRKIKKFFSIPNIPKLEDTWWGPGNPTKDDAEIERFEINIPEEVLKDLRQRLDIALPFQEPLENAKQHYGMNTNLLKTIVDHWKNEYDWREQEKFLNKFPQFKVSVQGLKIHFLHVKPIDTDGLKVYPLLLVHGWPGSVREFYEMIPLLTNKQSGRNFVFEIIAPSLPGYGFSDATTKQGLGSVQMAVIFKNLMEKLGFRKYYIQGGDWGSIITSHMAVLFPDRILGIHSNMPIPSTPMARFKIMVSTYFPKLVFRENESIDTFRNVQQMWTNENAYAQIQSTKPDTVGVGLRDSPVGLAAYILEKFITWTNRDWRDLEDGGLTRKYTYTKLIDNVMIYWVNRCITTSVRLYYEHLRPENQKLEVDRIPITNVPCGCSRFLGEIFIHPESVIKEKYQNLLHITLHNDGGHFAAFEVPDILAEDIYDFVEKANMFR